MTAFQKSQILYEDNHLIAVNKLAGQLVQTDDEGKETSLEEELKDYIRWKYQKPGAVFLGVIHRLDRPVSGLCVFARTSKALERMNKLFSSREVTKTYLALVHGKPPAREETLVHYLIKDTSRNISHAYTRDRKDAVRAELTYKLVRQADNVSLLEVTPLTGRPHQIRVQLSKIGCPIVGDLKYGSQSSNRDRSICLHAYSLEFIHPVKKEPMKLLAPMGPDHIINVYLG